MKKTVLIAALLTAALISGCGNKQTEKPDKQVDNTYTETETQSETADGTELISVTDETVIAENREIVSSMLDCFKSLDYEGALVYVRESDRELLNVESAQSNAAYQALLPKMSYEIGDSYANARGDRFVDVQITAPSMQEIYGQVFIRMNDAMMKGEISSDEQAAEFNNNAIIDIVANGDVGYNTMDVRVGLDVDGDSGVRAVLSPELMNAMLGDIQNAQRQMEETVGDSVSEYNQAKEAGVFDGE